jgi:hypothetical protein
MAILRGIGGVAAVLLRGGDEHVALAELRPAKRGNRACERRQLGEQANTESAATACHFVANSPIEAGAFRCVGMAAALEQTRHSAGSRRRDDCLRRQCESAQRARPQTRRLPHRQERGRLEGRPRECRDGPSSRCLVSPFPLLLRPQAAVSNGSSGRPLATHLEREQKPSGRRTAAAR